MKRAGGRPLDRQSLELWQRSPRGRRLLEMEEQELRRVLPDLFGRHVLQIGSWGVGDRLLAASEMLHRAVLATVSGGDAQAVADPESLPILDHCVDAVLLPHSLEFARSPQSVLREANRILTHRGRLLILGFNPWSAWALRSRIGFRHPSFPPGARFVSLHRLSDWLELLDFEVVEVRRFGIGFPWIQARSDGEGFSPAALLAPMAESYLLVAKKRVIPLTLVGRIQRAAVRSVIGTAAVPNARTQVRIPEGS